MAKSWFWRRFPGWAGRWAIGLGMLLPPIASGCDSNRGVNSPETFDQGSLDEVAEIYKSAASRLKRPPGSLKELVGGAAPFKLGYDSIASGDVIVYWGVDPIPDDQPTDEILGYKAKVPTEGGAVLLKNGTVRRMTAAEFQAARKPPGPTSK